MKPMKLSRSYRAFLHGFLELGVGQTTLAELLAGMIDLPLPLCYYLAAPVPIAKDTGWQDMTPEQLIKAVHRERLDRVLDEFEAGKIGIYATPAEIVSALQGSSHVAPMQWEYGFSLVWAFSQMCGKHDWLHFKSPEEWWEFTDTEPIPFDLIKHEYNYIARTLRKSMVEHGKSKFQRSSKLQQSVKNILQSMAGLDEGPEKEPKVIVPKAKVKPLPEPGSAIFLPLGKTIKPNVKVKGFSRSLPPTSTDE